MADIPPFVANLREADVNECRAALPVPLTEALRLTMEMGLGTATLVTLPDGRHLALLGLAPRQHREGVGVISLLATKLAEQHVHTLHRALRPTLDEALQTYSLLTNMLWTRNELHVRWLKRIGGQIIAHHRKVGPFGEPFFEFIITRASLTPFSRSIH